MPRINFVSFTFLFAFGLGSFAGIGMALLAVALARPADETRIIDASPAAVVATSTVTPTATPAPTHTPTPIPPPRTTSTLRVHIGPDEDYAILGTLASGNEVSVQGRDTSGDWVAIEFPPGSSARGWIPTDDIDGLSFSEIRQLEVLQATLIDTSPRSPISTSTPTLFEGNDGIPSFDDDDDPTPTRTPTPQSAPSTATPALTIYGPTDFAFGGVAVGPDGSIRVTVVNAGDGNVPALSISVAATGLGSELLSTGVVMAGETVTFRTSSILLTDTTAVSVTIDPNGILTDTNRANNTRNLTLSP